MRRLFSERFPCLLKLLIISLLLLPSSVVLPIDQSSCMWFSLHLVLYFVVVFDTHNPIYSHAIYTLQFPIHFLNISSLPVIVSLSSGKHKLFTISPPTFFTFSFRPNFILRIINCVCVWYKTYATNYIRISTIYVDNRYSLARTYMCVYTVTCQWGIGEQ